MVKEKLLDAKKDTAGKFIYNKMNFLNSPFFLKNKNAVSEIIATVIILALVMVIGAIIFAFTRGIVTDKIEKSEACPIDILDKVTLNREYVCYFEGGNKVVFSINVEDIQIDGLLVSIANEKTSDVYRMPSDLRVLSFSNGGASMLPQKKSGDTYFVDFSGRPVAIKIAPIISENQCDVSDT